MKLKLKDVVTHLLRNDNVDMLVLIYRQLAEQQLLRKNKQVQLPPTLMNLIVKKICRGHAPAQQEDETSQPIQEAAKKTRRYYIRRPKETSNWWSQFLTENHWLVLRNDKKHRNTLMFKTLFRVDFENFQLLRDILLDHKWYDPDDTNLFGI
jgi:hypothetical protein